jgi:hypothetical protein
MKVGASRSYVTKPCQSMKRNAILNCRSVLPSHIARLSPSNWKWSRTRDNASLSKYLALCAGNCLRGGIDRPTSQNASSK